MFSIFKKSGQANLKELYFPKARFKWTLPWWNLEDNQKLQPGLQKELNAEIGPKHPLWNLKPIVFGMCNANDDILVHLNDGRFACVHLVWHGKIDGLPHECPSTLFFESAEQLQVFLNEEAEGIT